MTSEAREHNQTTSEHRILARLFAQYNRAIIEKMRARGLEIPEEGYDLPEVLRYTKNESDRRAKMASDANAMKAQLFVEWLEETNQEEILKKAA